MSEPSTEAVPADEGAGEGRESGESRLVDAFARTADSPGSPSLPGTLAIGTLLGGTYRLDELIGRGGMGAVYKATHRTLHRAFAVKVVVASSADDARAAWRLVQEARTTCTLRHDHIIDVTDLGHTEEGLVYVVMELLEGEDLAQRIDRQAALAEESDGDAWLPDDEAQQIFDEVLDGVAAAHRGGFIHRDLKPGNVFLSRRDERTITKILDFGMSKAAQVEEGSVRLTHTGQLVGTPLYMAPEQSRGAPVDHRSDIYSVGVMMYEVLSGRVPFPADSIYECILKHATEAPPSLAVVRPDLPPEVVSLVERCLAKKPEERFQSAEELRAEWRRAWGRPSLDGEPATRTSGHHAVVPAEPARARRAWIGALIAVPLLAGAAALAWPSGEAAVDDAHDLRAEPTVERRVAVDPPLEVPTAPPVEVAEALAPPPQPPAPRTIRIESSPRGAVVLRDGARVGTTPFELVVTPGDEPVTLTLRRPRHRSAQVTVEADGPALRTVELAREPAPPLAPPPLAPPYP